MQDTHDDARVFLRLYQELTPEELEQIDEALGNRDAHRQKLDEIQSELDALSSAELQGRHEEEDEYLEDVEEELRSNASSDFGQEDSDAIEDECRLADARTLEDLHEILIANRYPGVINLLEGWIEQEDEKLSGILLDAAKRARQHSHT